MNESDRARCWDALKEACFDQMQPNQVFGIKFPSEKNEVARQLMGILTHVEMTVGRNK